MFGPPTKVAIGCVIVLAVLTCSCGSRGGSSQGISSADTVLDTSTSLVVGDEFEVKVYDEEELSGAFQVAGDGTINFPLVGEVKVAGLEPTEVASLLSKRLKEGKFLQHPQVSVFVKETESRRISVVGAVRSPGSFPMKPGMTIVQALSLAGGFSALADKDKTVVSRRMKGRVRKFRVDVPQITRGELSDFPVRSGDIVYVPERIF